MYMYINLNLLVRNMDNHVVDDSVLVTELSAITGNKFLSLIVHIVS